MSFYCTLDFYKFYIHSKKRLNDMFRSLIVNSYYKPLSFSISNESYVYEKSLAHRQVPTKFSLARLEKPLAPGVGHWDLSAPGLHPLQTQTFPFCIERWLSTLREVY
jgi:hypothetical protein